MAARAETLITAGLRPELFSELGIVSLNRTLVIAALTVLVLVGFGFRATNLSAEGLSEDELNKLQAVGDYRLHGLTAANGEHPFFMKALQTGSVILADSWNGTSLATSPGWQISSETALRLPSTIFGALSIVLIYLLAAELFGAEVGLIAAALWAFDPNAIGFNRIAKEDTFLLFFFLLANVFWLRGQRNAEKGQTSERYYWLAAASFGAMLASKYVPQLLAITIGYYWIFQAIPETRWRLGHRKMLLFFAVMGAVFLILNPPVLLPDTWRQMRMFAGQKLVGHDGYEFMGQVYSHKMTEWLRGIPWYFYALFLIVKLPVLTLAGFVIGLPLLFRRKLGDGRYFLLFWMFLWAMMFTFAGGKFTRYLTVVMPAVMITAAIGVQTAGRFIAEKLASLVAGSSLDSKVKAYGSAVLALIVIAGSVQATASITPHYRLYLNAIGGGTAKAGFYFPHDEFYDASIREAVNVIAKEARPGARVACETPGLAAFYAQRAKRPDLVNISLSDVNAVKQMGQDDYVINARGRRYFSNDQVITALQRSSKPAVQLNLKGIPSADIYKLDHDARDLIVGIMRLRQSM